MAPSLPHPDQEPLGSPAPPPAAAPASRFSFEALKLRSPFFSVPLDERWDELQRMTMCGIIGVPLAFAVCYATDKSKKPLRLLRQAVRLGAAMGPLVQCLAWGVEIVRGKRDSELDRLLAAPIVSVLLTASQGPKAAATAAIWCGAIVAPISLSIHANRIYFDNEMAKNAPSDAQHTPQNAREATGDSV